MILFLLKNRSAMVQHAMHALANTIIKTENRDKLNKKGGGRRFATYLRAHPF